MRMSKRILVVDDSDETRKHLEGMLKPLGFEIFHAVDGVDALEQLRSEPADLAIVDLNMPRLDGLSLVRELRTSSTWSGLPVILMTTERREAEVRRAMEAGANLYLVKPSVPTIVRTKVLSLLGLSSAGA